LFYNRATSSAIAKEEALVLKRKRTRTINSHEIVDEQSCNTDQNIRNYVPTMNKGIGLVMLSRQRSG
jgi:hypothetical protein